MVWLAIFSVAPFPNNGSQLDYDITSGSILHLVLRLRGGGDTIVTDMMAGFAACGKITQKINRDPLPVTAYDRMRTQTLHISVLNYVHFSSLTGLPSPPSPISSQTYIKLGFPWVALYDEHIPSANNTSVSARLGTVKSIVQVDSERRASGASSNTQIDCSYCVHEMATLRFSPCGHVFCDDCATVTKCPQCRQAITSKERFAAPMMMPGKEDEDGIETASLDERIVMLEASFARGEIISFRSNGDRISPLCAQE